ncbi:type II toxin-antitoxin system Phd/YefM family antitoxin [Sandarakinorhabdus sp.]|jgi:prevent-host-death family protein|uniref:type II toxin-antitoxin system Phd/YefM family antitoxin n=1 Tax=Sandarakinorhabdus sp. TaxID=1916663 RepID=UPI00333E5AE3
MGEWPVHDAKARFSALIERATSDGPQRVTRHGKPVAVVMAEDEYRRLLAGETGPRPKRTLGQFLLTAPQTDIDLDELFVRDGPELRDVNFADFQ